MENKTNPAWERIESVITRFGEPSVASFARRIGLERPEILYRVKRGCNGISHTLASRITEAFPSVAYNWLKTGFGDNDSSQLENGIVLNIKVSITVEKFES